MLEYRVFGRAGGLGEELNKTGCTSGTSGERVGITGGYRDQSMARMIAGNKHQSDGSRIQTGCEIQPIVTPETYAGVRENSGVSMERPVKESNVRNGPTTNLPGVRRTGNELGGMITIHELAQGGIDQGEPSYRRKRMPSL